ncbi:hypothetical protein GCM10027186_34710 [Micromonospora schwarzwaldensis]
MAVATRRVDVRQAHRSGAAVGATVVLTRGRATIGRTLRAAVGATVVLTRGRATIGRTLRATISATVVLTRGRATIGRTLRATISATVVLTRGGTAVGRALLAAAAAGPDVVVVQCHGCSLGVPPRVFPGAVCSGWYPTPDRL